MFFPPKAGTPVNVSQVAARTGLPITEVKFDFTEQGIAQLDGWWIPAAHKSDINEATSAAAAKQISHINSSLVVLYCPNGRSILRNNVNALQSLHSLGVGVFAFDYRGFGQSEPGHPSQQKAYADGLAAFQYLTDIRHIQPSNIVIYGSGVGAAVAVHVGQQTPQIAGLMLENPQPSFAKQVKREQHIHVLPLWLIFPDRLDITHVVPELKQPKLFLITAKDRDVAALYRQAISPKQMVDVGSNRNTTLYSEAAWQQAVGSFLHELMDRHQ